ncbi:thioredoxin domain-containing protein [Hellea balneolensis]|uniref:thioredoxin domain-containing protein n=1 Tax=Hellea balneolensis TaxID=287478 RepID=UPI0003F560BC|nr:thioredoxin domain-containing protein [Hellea balneolensis]
MIKFTAGLLALSLFASTAFAQTTPMPKADAHSEHEHSQQTKMPAKDVPFALSEAPEDHVVGSDTAPITMIVWASVTCPHCSDWFTNEWPSIKKELIEPGKMRFVFRPLPTAPAQLAMVGFMMAECAPSDDYFKLIEYQMENQKMIFEAAEKGEARAEYDKIGKLAGLKSEEDINACLANKEKLAHIHLSNERANSAELQGVPAFYINGDVYEGKQDAETLTKLILDMSEKGLSVLPKGQQK